MKKQPLLLALFLTVCGYSANAQSSTSTTTTRQTTVTPASTPTAYPTATPAPASTTTTESSTTTSSPAQTTVIEKPVRVIPADARVKQKRNKTKIKR